MNKTLHKLPLRCWSVLVECNHLNFTSLYHVLNSTTIEIVPLQIRVFRLLRADFFSASNRMRKSIAGRCVL